MIDRVIHRLEKSKSILSVIVFLYVSMLITCSVSAQQTDYNLEFGVEEKTSNFRSDVEYQFVQIDKISRFPQKKTLPLDQLKKVTPKTETVTLSVRTLSKAPFYVRKEIEFIAEIKPAYQGLQYKFDFGDGTLRDWSRADKAEHIYAKPGIYEAYVVARIAQKEIIEISSHMIAVKISAPSEPAQPGKWKWIIPGGLISIGGGYYLLSRMKKQKMGRRFTPRFHIRPNKDTGAQEIQSAASFHPDAAICLKAVLDTGSQIIKVEGSLIKENRREHE